VIDDPELEANIGVFKKSRAKSPIDPGSQIIDIKVIDSDIIHIDVAPELAQPTETPVTSSSWAKKANVTVYEPNFFRKRLEASENKQIAFAAYTLLKKYGVEAKDEQQQTSGKIYHADAFVIKNHGADKYSIYRRHDDVELMTFQADKWGHVGNIKLSYTEIESEPKIWREKQINILPIERQEFLLVADYLKTGKELPSVDEDPRKIASVVGSVSPKGTHNILESFKENEVLKILTQSITSFEKDDLTLGNYRIIFRQTSDNTSTLQLLKTEHNGTNREAVRFQFEKTDTGMTHQVQGMAITEADLEKLRLLAQKLHINYKALFGNPTDTRDIDLPVHPEINRNLNDDQSHQSTQSTPNAPDRKTQSNPQGVSSNSPKQQNAVSHSTTSTPNGTTPSQPTKRPNFSSNLDNAVLPLHPVLKQYWEQLEKDGSSHETVAQGHLEFQSKIQETGKLTVGEQRELYQQIQNLAWSEINHFRRTDIVLPPLAHIVNDLRSQVQKEAQPQFSSDPKRDTPVSLHPDIASHWHDLETNKTWSSVANQYNNPLREKLVTTGKLTIGEQRELYQKILLQSQFEQQNIGQTNISLPPLSDIIQDLLNTRSQIINNTYTPKVEVHSQKAHTPQRPTTNSEELEL
jgi:polyhydroxyalkanoate synthesis regulator phasin